MKQVYKYIRILIKIFRNRLSQRCRTKCEYYLNTKLASLVANTY